MKHLAIVTAIVITTLSAACVRTENRLTFDSSGQFKVLQLTDLHLQDFHPDQVEEVFARMDSLVVWEKPDLIAVTGDIVYSTPADVVMLSVINKLDSYAKPWIIVYGNHDHEHGFTLAELASLIVKGKNSLNILGQDGSLADFSVPIDNRAYLYFLDSHAYADTTFFSYAWFKPEQVEWLRESASAHSSKPSYAFFHIPLCEYTDTTNHTGTYGESVCCGKKNTGMFNAMKETGFVATFCGHDHDNDYVVEHDGVLLAYGRYSGSNGEYNHLPKGARVIVIHRNGTLETWIRDGRGQITDRVRFDGTLKRF